MLAGRCGRNNSPWKESVAGKKIIQGVRGDLKSRIAATGYLYGLLTTQDLNCALRNFLVLVRSLSAKKGPDRYRSDKSTKFGTELL